MKKRIVRKSLAILLLSAMTASLFGGCGGQSGNESGINTQEANDTAAGEQGTSESAEGVAMGRYIEEVTDLSDSLYGYKQCIRQMDDGSIVVADVYSGFLISKDNGVTWEQDTREWFVELQKNETYIMDMALGSDNTVAVIYHADEDSEADEETDEDADSEAETDTLNPKLMIYKPDGTEVPVYVDTTEEDVYLQSVYISDHGRIFASALGSGNIYEVFEDGSSELFLTLENRAELIQFQDNLMIVDAYGFDGPSFYDMEKKQWIEDEVLAEFVSTNYGDRYGSYIIDAYPIYFFPGEEGTLYIAGSKGLYRHVIGGSAIEQVIDGTLCTFSNPAYYLCGMLLLDNNEFLTIFTNSRLVRYVYDPDIPTVPNKKLKVYSLMENDTIRQAIALYQSADPSVFVEYEIGMEEGGSITRDDALKNLNTKIMAGEGPDILVLDDMPYDSYVEKGLLLDLHSVLDTMDGEDALFPNIVEAMKEGEQIYTLPCEVQLPVILGAEKNLGQAENLAEIADTVEALRQDNPGNDIIGVCSEKAVMRLFAMTCVPAWTNVDGTVNTDAIADFLMQTKRIYDAQMDGIAQERIDAYNNDRIYFAATGGIPYDDTDYLRTSVDEISYIAGLTRFECGALQFPYSYATTISVKMVKGFEDSGWIPMNGQSSNVFCAKTLLGISAASTQTDEAEAFIRTCLSKENQTSMFYGYAVNQAAFDRSFTVDAEDIDKDGIYGSIGVSSEDGMEISMDVYWPNEEEKAAIRQYMETADTPYIENKLLEDAVYEEGIVYIGGGQSLEEAISGIEKKISLYLAE